MLLCVEREENILDIFNAYEKDSFELKNVIDLNMTDRNEYSEHNFRTLRRIQPKWSTLQSLDRERFESLKPHKTIYFRPLITHKPYRQSSLPIGPSWV